MKPHLEAIVRDGALTAPHIGRFTASCRAGDVLVPGQSFGRLQLLNRRYEVLVPAGAMGRVTEVVASHRPTACCYDEVLVRVDAAALGDAAPVQEVSDGLELEAGQRVIRAQMDGMFYLRPSPDEPPFVELGATLEPGGTFGLVEVMKFFYPVVFEGDEAVVLADVLVGDATPVEAGAPLIVVGPAD